MADVWNDTPVKQDELVSGVNIKTINGDTILGAGDLAIDTTANDDFKNDFLLGGM